MVARQKFNELDEMCGGVRGGLLRGTVEFMMASNIVVVFFGYELIIGRLVGFLPSIQMR